MPDAPSDTGRRPSLEYDRAGGAFASRRTVRLLMAFTLFNTVLLVVLVLGVQPAPLVRAKWQQWQAAREAARFEKRQLAIQQQCLTHAVPPGRVVYEEDPLEAAKLLAGPRGAYNTALHRNGVSGTRPPNWQPPVRAADPDFVARFSPTAGHPESGSALLFLHGRTTPSGEQRLVMVRLTNQHLFRSYPGGGGYGGYSGFGGSFPGTPGVQPRGRQTPVTPIPGPAQFKQRTIDAIVITPAAPGRGADAAKASSLRLRLPDDQLAQPALGGPGPYGSPPPATAPSIDYGNALRVFAGQPDPADPTHFTIPYQVDGQPGVIDGWLRDNDLLLKPRAGAPAADGSVDWVLPTGGTTRPAP